MVMVSIRDRFRDNVRLELRDFDCPDFDWL